METRSRSKREAVAVLSEDIMVEILLRLPVKSLIRFKCVCKRWQSLIGDPNFAKLQLTRSTSEENYFDHRRFFVLISTGIRATTRISASVRGQIVGYSGNFVCVAPGFNNSRYTRVSEKVVVYDFLHRSSLDVVSRVEGSCNGLICLTYGSNNYHLLNPTTDELKPLPNPGDEIYQGSLRRVGGYLLTGLGYDSSTHDYKFVRGKYYPHRTKTQVFSLKANAWRTIEEYPTYHCSLASNVFVNGALHWRGKNRFDGNGALPDAAIVSFDLKEEKFMEMPLPHELGNGSYLTLGDLRGELTLIQHNFNDGHQLWTMKEYGVQNSWTKLVKIPPAPNKFIPFDYTEDGNIMLLGKKNLYIYNFTREALVNSNLVVSKRESFYWVGSYVETLISPNNYR